MFGNSLIRQKIGMPIGIEPTTFWANPSLYTYGNEYIFELASFQCALLLCWVASNNHVKATVVQLSSFCSSRLPFQIAFGNLSKKSIMFLSI